MRQGEGAQRGRLGSGGTVSASEIFCSIDLSIEEFFVASFESKSNKKGFKRQRLLKSGSGALGLSEKPDSERNVMLKLLQD